MPSEQEPEFPLEEGSDNGSETNNIVSMGGTANKNEKADQDEANRRRCDSEGDEDNRVGAMDEDDDELESFIRIRSQGDNIFEQDEEDDDEDEFYDFAIPEVELRAPPSRKRKQEISYIENDLSEVIEMNMTGVEENEDEDQVYVGDAAYRIHADLFKSRKRDPPLYLLNPEDFAHDPKKQMQIRRAIITYRHHQDKKEQIIKLTDENKRLREHVQELRSKVMELGRCGCKKNQTANLDVLDVEIPVVLPRMFKRGSSSKPVLAVPYNRCSLSPNSFERSSAEIVKTELEATRVPLPSVSSSAKSAPAPLTSMSNAELTKPLINITSSRLANLNSNTLSTNNVVTSKPPINKVFTNGTSSSILKALQSGNANRISITGATANMPGFVPISMAATIKTEPGIPSPSIMATKNSKLPAAAPSPASLLAALKSETASPATATPVSRIVFAKKGNTSNAVQTASQLLFGSKNNPQASNSMGAKKVAVPERNSPLTASQLAFANRNLKPTTVTSPFSITNSINNRRIPPKSNQIFKTASGQVLKLVQPSRLTRKVSNGISMRGPTPNFKPIAPKPTGSLQHNAEAFNRLSKEQMEEMWQHCDNDDDELAIIAAINGTSPPQRNRKQAMEPRTKADQEKANTSSNASIIKSFGEIIELDKYQDIVFEEAD